MRSLSSLSFPAKYAIDWIRADCPHQATGYLPGLVVAREEGWKQVVSLCTLIPEIFASVSGREIMAHLSGQLSSHTGNINVKVLVNENMSHARDLLSRLGEATVVPGCSTPIAQLADADALTVYSVTKVNESLLVGKPTKFVGTATAGIDHVDKAWLEQAGIGFSTAPGHNVIAMVEYVLSSLLTLTERDEFSLRERTMGIVGVGNAGRRLQTQLEVLGIKTLLCDPSRVNRGDGGDFYSLGELVQHAGILTFHTPPFKDGPYKTLHLADERLARNPKPGVILINACRGAVVDNTALLACLNEGQKLSIVLDVWEDEPELNVGLPKKVGIGTSHIAGYTLEGKAHGTAQVFEVYGKFIGYEQHVALDTLLPAPGFGHITLRGPLDQPTLKRLVYLVYDVYHDGAPLRKVVRISGEFDKLRKNYPKHREWSSLHVVCDDASAASLLCKLGSNAVHHSAR